MIIGIIKLHTIIIPTYDVNRRTRITISRNEVRRLNDENMKAKLFKTCFMVMVRTVEKVVKVST